MHPIDHRNATFADLQAKVTGNRLAVLDAAFSRWWLARTGEGS